eukprot:2132235-Amphidinium_carterae.3
MLALVDPACYPWGTKSQKRTAEKAQAMRSKWYTSSVSAVNDQMTIRHTQARRGTNGPLGVEAAEPTPRYQMVHTYTGPREGATGRSLQGSA